MSTSLSSTPAVKHIGIALVLAAAGAISVLLVLPYLFALMPQLSAKIHVPLALFAAAQTAQAGSLFFLLAWIGLRLGYAHGLDAPVLRQWLRAGPMRPLPARWLPSIGLGLAVACICILIDKTLGAWAPSALVASMPEPEWWKGLLASFYGGISEEMLCRLFLVSLLVWLGARMLHASSPRAGIYWAAIVIAAVLFGIGHLPTLAQATTLNAANVSRVIGLNALCGIVFGWLFWRRGLEHAIAAHFSADLVLHVAAPLFSSG
jgi:membrane protease YdiL (CAAX protease family)